MIHTLNNDTAQAKAWCGPAAISMLTGTPISKIEKMVRRIRNENSLSSQKEYKKPVKGMLNQETLKVLKRLGAKVTIRDALIKTVIQPSVIRIPDQWMLLLEARYPQTLATFVEDTKFEKYPYLINVRSHYMVSYKGKVADNNHVIPVKPSKARPKRRIYNAWQVRV